MTHLPEIFNASARSLNLDKISRTLAMDSSLARSVVVGHVPMLTRRQFILGQLAVGAFLLASALPCIVVPCMGAKQPLSSESSVSFRHGEGRRSRVGFLLHWRAQERPVDEGSSALELGATRLRRLQLRASSR